MDREYVRRVQGTQRLRSSPLDASTDRNGSEQHRGDRAFPVRLEKDNRGHDLRISLRPPERDPQALRNEALHGKPRELPRQPLRRNGLQEVRRDSDVSLLDGLQERKHIQSSFRGRRARIRLRGPHLRPEHRRRGVVHIRRLQGRGLGLLPCRAQTNSRCSDGRRTEPIRDPHITSPAG